MTSRGCGSAGFIEAAKALASRGVFVASRVLAEADFEYLHKGGRFGGPPPDGEPKAVDLVAVEPRLGEFKAHLGRHCGHRLWVGADRTTLEHVILLPWWERLAELREGAIAALVRDQNAALVRRIEDEQRQQEPLVERLRGFIADPEFVKIPTQIAMQAYAVERVPELESLGDKTLRAEIQALDAKIKARGLRGKK